MAIANVGVHPLAICVATPLRLYYVIYENRFLVYIYFLRYGGILVRLN